MQGFKKLLSYYEEPTMNRYSNQALCVKSFKLMISSNPLRSPRLDTQCGESIFFLLNLL